MLNLPTRISASQIRCLQDCWRKYLYRYGMGLKDANADAEYFVIGRVFDDLVHGLETVDLIDLRPLDESKKDYRGMLKGMLESIRAVLDTSRLCAPEFEIKTETETMRIDGIYCEGADWWLVEFKTPSGLRFNLEEKKQLLRLDTQIAAYFTAVDYIADSLMLSKDNFKGCKYYWVLKPTSMKNPKYVTHSWELTAADLYSPETSWRNALRHAKMAQEAIKAAYSDKDPFAVPMNHSSCVTMTGVCGYYEQCYGARPVKVGDTSE